MEADAAVFAGVVPALADVVGFLAVDEAGFLVEDAAAAVDVAPEDFLTVKWEALVEVVFLASALAAGAKTAQAPNQALNNDAIRIRFIDSI